MCSKKVQHIRSNSDTVGCNFIFHQKRVDYGKHTATTAHKMQQILTEICDALYHSAHTLSYSHCNLQ